MANPEATRFLARHIVSQAEAGKADLDWSSLAQKAASEGLPLTEQELIDAAATILKQLADAGQLPDEALDAVSGGTSLGALIEEVDAMQESARNDRQTATTQFSNYNQKSTQYFNMLSSVMKNMNSMRMGTVRNML